MDTVTHGLIGAVVARSGFRQRLGAPATVALVTGVLLPDIDFVMGFFDQMAAVKYHRGLTHSLIGGIPLAMLAAVLLRKWYGTASYWTLTGLVYLGVGLHTLSDLPTSYGTMIFFPLSTKRYALDWVFIMDPVYTAILVAGLALGWWQPERAQGYARASLVTLCLYITMAGVAHQVALARFRDELTARGIRPVQVAMFPELPGLLRWQGVAQDGATFYESRHALWDWDRSGLTVETYRNQVSDKELARVARLDEVHAYLQFARFPWVQVKGSPTRRILEFRDLRFGSHGRRDSFLLRVILEDNRGEPQVSFTHHF
ncbi:MAG: metal-dependent hydrolase [Candidatus Methylomirabilales bacterium]